MESLEQKIDKLMVMMGKLVTKDDGQNRPVQTASLSTQKR